MYVIYEKFQKLIDIYCSYIITLLSIHNFFPPFISELMEENEESGELSEVEEEHHDKPGEKPLSCLKTKKTLLKKSRAKKSVTCTQCGKSFLCKRNLETHMIVHTGGKPYTCDQCGKSFSQKVGLMGHMRIHTGEKPYACDQRGKSFSQSSNLNVHMFTEST